MATNEENARRGERVVRAIFLPVAVLADVVEIFHELGSKACGGHYAGPIHTDQWVHTIVHGYSEPK